MIEAGRETTVIYRSAPSAHFELDLSGMVLIHTITASDPTWTPTPSVRALEFEHVVGAGGGAGGVDGQGAGSGATSGPGSAGAKTSLLTTIIESTYAIIIGAAGTGGAAGTNNGANGGLTSVISALISLVANGGVGGSGRTATSGTSLNDGNAGGTSSGGDNDTQGEGTGVHGTMSGTPTPAQPGASSALGGGPRGVLDQSGIAASTPGTGGGSTSVRESATNWPGGNGADGIVIIKEYF
jgi:hypothetical protein